MPNDTSTANSQIKTGPRPAVPLADMLQDTDAGDAAEAGSAAGPGQPEATAPVASTTVAVVADDDDGDEDEGIEGEADHALVFVHQPKCLMCGHLVAFAEKKYKSCHFTAGNESCPAQTIKIAIQLDTRNIVRNFLNAEEEGDSEKLSRLYASLATKPEWGQRQIMEDLTAARAARNKR